ncbi:LysR family transcriptional regulator [Gulosibacter sediminis]|uniref:LysR family transcriptional regulator n=1 Tax=Gulosibacter sediminis TaxID=1729695 RepID=UPI0024AE0C77|nr:LysR family transcriptional regulator [Gulosibacter sediminis]
MLEMKRLRLLWELSTRGTVAAVADALRYTPSAVSQQLALLEREAGVPLLRKSGRRLEFTAAGLSLVREVEGLLNGLERAEAMLHSAGDEITGTIRVASFQTAVLALFPSALRHLRETAPHLRVELVQYEPGAALSETWARSFDLVVAEQYPHHATRHIPGLDRMPLTTDRIQLAVPPRGSGVAEFDAVESIADTAGLPWVMEPQDAATRHWAEQACRIAGFEPDVRFETADLQAHVRLIETGNAVALLPSLVHISTPRVRLLEIEGAPKRTLFTAAREASRGHPAISAVRDALDVVVREAEAARLTSSTP